MPKITRIITPYEKEYKICSMIGDTIEKISPSKWFFSYECFRLTWLFGMPIDKAKELANLQLKDWHEHDLPIFLKSLFEVNKKKGQEQLLRGNSITSDDLFCWFLYAEHLHGTFSQYSFDLSVNEDLEERAPALIDISNPEKVLSVGKTELSDAALKHIVENQKKGVAQIVDFEEGKWYCFYRTYRGVAGQEPGKHGSHLHFISFAYGIERDVLVSDFMKGKCPGSGFHVRLIESESGQ